MPQGVEVQVLFWAPEKIKSLHENDGIFCVFSICHIISLCIPSHQANTSSRLVHASFVMVNFLSPTRICLFTRKYHPFLVGRNISSLLRHCVLIAGNNVVSHFEMRGNSIRGSVMLRGKKCYRCFLQARHSKYIIQMSGTNITFSKSEKISTGKDHFSISFTISSSELRRYDYLSPRIKIVTLPISVEIRKIVTIHLMWEWRKIVSTQTLSMIQHIW